MGMPVKTYRNHDPASLAQTRAARPDLSVWVSANAGSGKTRVLTNRVARLLLAGAEPSRILCLTYTKAAAAEMQNRLFKTLGGWAMESDEKLDKAIDNLLADEEPPLGPKRRDAARRLFARALETPGGLKIQTIHAFCESLLSRFPLEAGVTPHFSVIDETETQKLLSDAQDKVVAARADNPDLAAAFELILRDLSEAGFEDMLSELTSKRALFDAADEDVEAALAAALGVSTGLRRTDLLDQWAARFDRCGYANLAAALVDHGGKKGGDYAAHLRVAIAQDTPPASAFEAARAALLTQAGAPRTRGFPNADLLERHPWTAEAIPAAQRDLTDLLAQLHAADRLEASTALAVFARAMLKEYAQAKHLRAGVDYDDLIVKAVKLLTRSEARDWIRYKLDGGIEHILVDEAQDTSPTQWKAVAALAEEFFAGDGVEARPKPDQEEGDPPQIRTIFAVGDEKQSIYSFQGAAPELLSQMGADFAARIGDGFLRSGLATSFRSTPAVLDFVDRVFADPATEKGLSFDGGGVKHQAFRAGQPGIVEMWPLVEPRPAPEAPPWDQPIDAPAPDDPKRRLADLIAHTIKGWIGKEPLPARGRMMRAGDVLVLVRSRGALSVGVIKRLKQLGVPVAGEDRLALGDQLAVKDLLALARFALFPEDDLTVATLLRSPFCDIDEATLFELAHGRPRGQSLWYALSNRREERAEFSAAHRFLDKIFQEADYLRPFELFSLALGPMGGRPRLIARLGAEAEDPIDEFLAQTLAFETSGAPTLQAFVAWSEARDAEIKRQQEQDRDEVRVMTAHGAKGLEAPVVILPDTCGSPTGGGRGPTLLDPKHEGAPPVWLGPSDTDPPALSTLREARNEREAEEHRRLLYVALTRAEDRLLICGAAGQRKAPDGCWHELCLKAITEYGEKYDSPVRDDAEVPLKGWRVVGEGDRQTQDHGVETVSFSPPPAPWLRAIPPTESVPSELSPSRLGGEDPEKRPKTRAAEHSGESADQAPASPDPNPEADGAMKAGAAASAFDPSRAKRRGTAIHLLLEHLPDHPAEDQPARADALLARAAPGPDFSEEDRAAMRAEALKVLASPDLAFAFAANSRPEVPVGARLEELGGAEIHGLIDRLVIESDKVLILDYKTGLVPDDTPEGYLRQLAAYRAALRQLYSDRAIEAGLIWTASATLDLIDPKRLDAAITRAGAELDRGRRPS